MQGSGEQGRHVSGAQATAQTLRSPDAAPPVAMGLGARESKCQEHWAQARRRDGGQGGRSAFSDSSWGTPWTDSRTE